MINLYELFMMTSSWQTFTLKSGWPCPAAVIPGDSNGQAAPTGWFPNGPKPQTSVLVPIQT